MKDGLGVVVGGAPAACLLLVLVSVLGHGGAATRAAFHVATNGRDEWSGRLPEPNAAGTDGPFRTLDAARAAVRAARKAGEKGTVRVAVRGGVYRLEKPMQFGPQDSGSAEGATVYEAWPGERPVLSGGRAIGGWTKGDGEVWTARVAGVKEGRWYFHQLWVNGRRAVRARHPNQGYLRTEGPLPGFENPHKFRGKAEASMGFRFKEGDLKPWANLRDVNLFAYHSWTASLHWIDKVDLEKKEVRFANRCGWPIGWWDRKQRYYVENVREALDAPGEWFLDRGTGVLHYWPRAGEDMAKAEATAPVLGELVRFLGEPEVGLPVEHIVLKGLAFHHADWLLPRDRVADGQSAAFLKDAAVYCRGARHVRLEGCEIAHVGGYGLWFAKGCQRCVAERCFIHDLGAGGVRIGETSSPRKPEEASDHNAVDNCIVHDGGHVFPAGIGVWIGRASHNRVSHCEIADFYYTGVSIGWSWGYAPSSAHHNVLEHCHIHHLGLGVLSDMGGIYTLGQSQGTAIRHNCFHDVYSYSYGGWGLYTDEGSTDIVMENNIVYNTKTGGFHQHYGKNNVVRNNVLAFSRTHQVQRTREEKHLSFTFERNILLCTNGQVLGSNWRNEQYKVDHNVYWVLGDEEAEFGGRDLEEWQATGQDKHSVVADPRFVDAAKYDFRLKPDSPALKLGFEPIDASTIGVRGDAAWVAKAKALTHRAVPPDDTPKAAQGIQDDFEATAVGEPAKGARTSGEEKGASIRVTDETAATGKHSLKFTDAPGLSHVWQPHMFYQPRLSKGRVRCTFAIRLEAGAICQHEWRTAGHPYKIGPSLRFEADGRLVAGGKTLATLPHGQWVGIQIDTTLGRRTAGTYDLVVTVQGKEPQRFAGLAFGSKGFRRLAWVGYISVAAAKAVFYLDDLTLARVGT